MITRLLFFKCDERRKKYYSFFLFEKKMELNWNDTHSQRLNERSGGDENKSTCNRAHARTPSLKAALHFLFFFFDFIHFSFSCHILFSIHFSVVGLKLTDVLVSELIIKFVAASYTAQHNKQQHFFWVLWFIVWWLLPVIDGRTGGRLGRQQSMRKFNAFFQNVK